MSRSVVVVTDGYVAVEAQAFRFIRKRLGDANLFSFGIGSSVNRALIEGMARAGMGSPFVVLNKAGAAAEADKLRKYIEAPVLTDIKVRFAGVDVYDIVPKALPDLMARRPLILFGKYRGKKKGVIEVVGAQGNGQFVGKMDLDPAAAASGNRPLRALWARKWAEQLMDQHAALGGDPEIEKAVTNLGLGYSLLTQFTSFVAIDSQIANAGGQLTTVKQPLPLPQGVSNLAVGGTRFKSSARQAYAPNFGPMPAADAPMGMGSANEEASAAPRPRPSPAATVSAAPPKTPPPGAVTVTKMTNVTQGSRARLRRRVEKLIGICARQSGFKGKLVIRLHPDGRIGTSGGDAAFISCLQARRVIQALAPELSRQILDDPSKAGVIEVTIR